MKKILTGLCALIFLVVSGLALAGGSNQGEPDEGEGNAQCPGPSNLSVGYVDNDTLDGLPGDFFPNPFLPTSDPNNPGGCTPANNCAFIGTPGPNGEWDAGVVKIDNPSSTTPLVVDNVTVDIGPVTGLDPWSTFFPKAIPPGGTLILTEDNTMFNFDTSDMPSSAGPPTCTQNAFIPVIHLTVGTSTQVTRQFADTTQVLNTGGRDKGLCSPKTNEGSPYVLLKEVKNKCECDSDENGDDNGQDGGQGNGNQN